MDPRTGILSVFALGAAVLIFDRPAPLAALVGCAALALALAPISAVWKLRAVGIASVVVASTAWTQSLFYAGVPRTALVEIGPVVVWREGLLHGAIQSLRLVAMGLAGTTLALSTPPDRLFAALVSLRAPHGIAFLAVTALRFVPLAGAEWLAVRRARARRGRPLWARSPWAWIGEEMRLLAPVAARAVRRARTLAESLEARGFDPVRPRRLRDPLAFRAWEIAWLAALGGAVGSAGAMEGLFRLYVAGLWSHPALRPLYGFVRAWF